MKMVGFFKFTNNIYLNNTINYGRFCFNEVNYFKKVEKQEVHRFDIYEGCDKIMQSDDMVKLFIDGREFKVDPNGDPIRINHSGKITYSHILCFSIFYDHYFSIDGKNRLFDPNMFDFGDSLIVINDIKGFLSQFSNVIENDERIVKCKMGPVEYVDEKKYQGEMGLFRKLSRYSYQNEYRIAILIDHSDQFIIDIGNINQHVAGTTNKQNCKNLVTDGIAEL